MARKKARRKAVRRAPIRRARAKAAPKRRRKSSKWNLGLPLTMEEHGYDFAAGALIGPLSEYSKPLQEKYLGAFGTYSDEAALGIMSWAGHKYGHGMIKKLSKEVYRGAVFSTGQQAGSDAVRAMLGRFTNRGMSTSSASGRTLR